MSKPSIDVKRRKTISAAAMFVVAGLHPGSQALGGQPGPDLRWFEEAARMRRLAQSWGDQAYGAVVVVDDVLVGEGPSRVIKNDDPDAHAEREAIRDAQRRLGRRLLTGSVLYSTSRPCGLCEAAAAQAQVGRMYFGPSLVDAGVPGRSATSR